MKNKNQFHKKETVTDSGLSGLLANSKANKTAARQLFLMVASEKGTDVELKALVSQRSLLELIFFIIDLKARSSAVANQAKSKELDAIAKIEARNILYAWLDKNIDFYAKKLDECAEVAAREIEGLNRAEDWIRKQITEYRKNKKLY